MYDIDISESPQTESASNTVARTTPNATTAKSRPSAKAAAPAPKGALGKAVTPPASSVPGLVLPSPFSYGPTLPPSPADDVEVLPPTKPSPSVQLPMSASTKTDTKSTNAASAAKLPQTAESDGRQSELFAQIERQKKTPLPDSAPSPSVAAANATAKSAGERGEAEERGRQAEPTTRKLPSMDSKADGDSGSMNARAGAKPQASGNLYAADSAAETALARATPAAQSATISRRVVAGIKAPRDMNWGQLSVVLPEGVSFQDGTKARVLWRGAVGEGENVRVSFNVQAAPGSHSIRVSLQEVVKGEAQTIVSDSVSVSGR